MSFVPLKSLESCPVGRGCFVEFEGRELAVFRLPEDGGVHVIDNTCPHANGNLAGGHLEGTVVHCPWHEWPFDITTGQCTRVGSPARVDCYPVKVENGQILVDLDRQPSSSHLTQE